MAYSANLNDQQFYSIERFFTFWMTVQLMIAFIILKNHNGFCAVLPSSNSLNTTLCKLVKDFDSPLCIIDFFLTISRRNVFIHCWWWFNLDDEVQMEVQFNVNFSFKIIFSLLQFQIEYRSCRPIAFCWKLQYHIFVACFFTQSRRISC